MSRTIEKIREDIKATQDRISSLELWVEDEESRLDDFVDELDKKEKEEKEEDHWRSIC